MSRPMRAPNRCGNCDETGHNAAKCDKPSLRDRLVPWADRPTGKRQATEQQLVAELVERLGREILPERLGTVLIAIFRGTRLNAARSDANTFAEILEEADMLVGLVPHGEDLFSRSSLPPTRRR